MLSSLLSSVLHPEHSVSFSLHRSVTMQFLFRLHFQTFLITAFIRRHTQQYCALRYTYHVKLSLCALFCIKYTWHLFVGPSATLILGATQRLLSKFRVELQRCKSLSVFWIHTVVLWFNTFAIKHYLFIYSTPQSETCFHNNHFNIILTYYS